MVSIPASSPLYTNYGFIKCEIKLSYFSTGLVPLGSYMYCTSKSPSAFVPRSLRIFVTMMMSSVISFTGRVFMISCSVSGSYNHKNTRVKVIPSYRFHVFHYPLRTRKALGALDPAVNPHRPPSPEWKKFNSRTEPTWGTQLSCACVLRKTGTAATKLRTNKYVVMRRLW